MFVMGAGAIVMKIQHHRHGATAATGLAQGETQGSLRICTMSTRTFRLSMSGIPVCIVALGHVITRL